LVGAVFRNFVLEDQKTGSWWYQVTGRAQVGPMEGAILPSIDAEQMSLAEWLKLHPDSDLLVPDEASEAGYHIFGFDSFDGRHPDESDERYGAKAYNEWVVGVTAGASERAYAWFELEHHGVIQDDLEGVPVAV